MTQNVNPRPAWQVELSRIAKYLMITLAVNLLLSMLWLPVYRWMTAEGGQTIRWASALYSYGHLISGTILLTLLHRAFTFRATEKWYIALPLMVASALVFRVLSSWVLVMVEAAAGMQITAVVLTRMTTLNSYLWMACAYLLQRYVIYCHSTDDNWWYRKRMAARQAREEAGV